MYTDVQTLSAMEEWQAHACVYIEIDATAIAVDDSDDDETFNMDDGLMVCYY